VKKILVWLLAAFLLQYAVYDYLDRVVFAPSVAFTQKTIGGSGPVVQSVMYSYNHSYYSDLSATDLKIYVVRGNRLVKDVSLADNETVSYLSWLPDRNIVLAGTATDYPTATTVALLAIDPETGAKPVTPEIRGMAKGARIEGVAFSTKTNVTNILVRDVYGTWVWRTDANNYLRRLNLDDWDINRIASLQYQDTLLYDDTVLDSVYAYFYGGRISKIPLGTIGRYALIGTDQNDNVYLGSLDRNDLVTGVFEGKVNGGFSEIKSITPPAPVNAVTVAVDGTVSVASGYVAPYGVKHERYVPPPTPVKRPVLPESAIHPLSETHSGSRTGR
jgi:hypothetical protein